MAEAVEKPIGDDRPKKITIKTHGDVAKNAAIGVLKIVNEFPETMQTVTLSGSNMRSDLLQIELSDNVMIEVYVITHDRINKNGNYKPVTHTEVYKELTV